MTRTIEAVYESGVLRPLEPLPFAENQRVLVTVSEKAEAPKRYFSGEKEMEWLRQHSKEYEGEYVVLDGDRLVAHGKDGREALRQARSTGLEAPFVSHIPPSDEPPFGGW